MTVTDILSRSQLRNFLLAELKDIIEMPDNSVKLIGYGYGKGYNLHYSFIQKRN